MGTVPCGVEARRRRLWSSCTKTAEHCGKTTGCTRLAADSSCRRLASGGMPRPAAEAAACCGSCSAVAAVAIICEKSSSAGAAGGHTLGA